MDVPKGYVDGGGGDSGACTDGETGEVKDTGLEEVSREDKVEVVGVSLEGKNQQKLGWRENKFVLGRKF